LRAERVLRHHRPASVLRASHREVHGHTGCRWFSSSHMLF
jgi:hypothetical protein